MVAKISAVPSGLRVWDVSEPRTYVRGYRMPCRWHSAMTLASCFTVGILLYRWHSLVRWCPAMPLALTHPYRRNSAMTLGIPKYREAPNLRYGVVAFKAAAIMAIIYIAVGINAVLNECIGGAYLMSSSLAKQTFSMPMPLTQQTTACWCSRFPLFECRSDLESLQKPVGKSHSMQPH